MNNKGNLRIYRTRLYLAAIPIALLLASLLYIEIGTEPALVIVKAIGSIVFAMFITHHFIEPWFWKTKLGLKLGFPPNYSGEWEGLVTRTQSEDGSEKQSKVKVTITQQINQLEWHQKTYSMENEKVAESHFILGEVVDYHRKWDGIIGIYEVSRTTGEKNEGMSLVTVNESLDEIYGLYCGLNNHMGNIKIKKIKGS